MEEWSKVPYRKGKGPVLETALLKPDDIEVPFDPEAQKRRVDEARLELLDSDVYHSAVAALREGLSTLHSPTISEIICLGLGQVGELYQSRHQFSFLLCLREHFDNVTVSLYDPLFSSNDKKLLEMYGCKLLKEEKKDCSYKTKPGQKTLYFMPHLPYLELDNFLAANWSLELSNIVILGNSLHTCQMEFTKPEMESVKHIAHILPHLVEYPVFDTYQIPGVFNNTVVSVFPEDRLQMLPADFWAPFPCDLPIS